MRQARRPLFCSMVSLGPLSQCRPCSRRWEARRVTHRTRKPPTSASHQHFVRIPSTTLILRFIHSQIFMPPVIGATLSLPPHGALRAISKSSVRTTDWDGSYERAGHLGPREIGSGPSAWPARRVRLRWLPRSRHGVMRCRRRAWIGEMGPVEPAARNPAGLQSHCAKNMARNPWPCGAAEMTRKTRGQSPWLRSTSTRGRRSPLTLPPRLRRLRRLARSNAR